MVSRLDQSTSIKVQINLRKVKLIRPVTSEFSYDRVCVKFCQPSPCMPATAKRSTLTWRSTFSCTARLSRLKQSSRRPLFVQPSNASIAFSAGSDQQARVNVTLYLPQCDVFLAQPIVARLQCAVVLFKLRLNTRWSKQSLNECHVNAGLRA